MITGDAGPGDLPEGVRYAIGSVIRHMHESGVLDDFAARAARGESVLHHVAFDVFKLSRFVHDGHTMPFLSAVEREGMLIEAQILAGGKP